MRPLHLVCLALLAGSIACTTPRATGTITGAGTSPSVRAAELARVRCLLVAPIENASDVPLAADAATTALLAALDPSRTRAFPIPELRYLFRDTPLELPEGVSPSLAVELAEILGADAALYGAVEGRRTGEDGALLVTLRLALAGQRDLLFAQSIPVSPGAHEEPDAAVRRAVAAAAQPVMARLGGSGSTATCFDPERAGRVRALALAQAAPTPRERVVATRPAPVGKASAQPKTPRQAEWAKKVALLDRFVVDGLAFEGRTARLVHDAGLVDLAVALAANPASSVRIEGYVDGTSDPSQDAQLSMAMAQAAGRRLLELGVSKDQLSWAGRGSERPLLPNFTARGRAANRRLEVVGLK